MATAKKRIVICADGTWNDPEDDVPTNVLRLARAIRPESADGVQQVVFYDWGVGSYYSKVRGGASGLGMLKNIQDGYRFIVQNYDRGDEIFLFGYSRGAYTVRALAGMLNSCGILSKKNADQIPEAFNFYRKRSAKPSSPEASRWRKKYTGTTKRGHVDFLGVWDTVGALGIPTRVLAFVEEKDLFFDEEIGSNVCVARHAVAIDEHRADFQPTLWEDKDAVDIEQVWFAGVHGDVGGGEKPRDGRLLSDIPLAWMAAEAGACGLAVARHLHGRTQGLHEAPIHRSHRGFWKVLGKHTRTIPPGGVVHGSVRDRHRVMDYQSAPLRAWLTANGGWGAVAGR